MDICWPKFFLGIIPVISTCIPMTMVHLCQQN